MPAVRSHHEDGSVLNYPRHGAKDTPYGREARCGYERCASATRMVHAAFFLGRPLPRFTLTPMPLAALVVFVDPLPPPAG